MRHTGAAVILAVAVAGCTISTSAGPAASPAHSVAAGTVLGTWSGTGTENTPSFKAPASGDYIVSWSYSDNSDPALGAGGTNFIIQSTDTGADALGLPDAIALSGHGSTEVTGASGVQSFNVNAAGHWTITVKAAD